MTSLEYETRYGYGLYCLYHTAKELALTLGFLKAAVSLGDTEHSSYDVTRLEGCVRENEKEINSAIERKSRDAREIGTNFSFNDPVLFQKNSAKLEEMRTYYDAKLAEIARVKR